MSLLTVKDIESKANGKHIRYLVFDDEINGYRDATEKEKVIHHVVTSESYFVGTKYNICILHKYPNERLAGRKVMIER